MNYWEKWCWNKSEDNLFGLFVRLTARLKENSNGCWIYRSNEKRDTYPSTSFAGKQIRVHRASWLIHRGSIPVGMLVCHTCDNRQCANPAHLFLGTQSDNMKDASRKGRLGKGNAWKWRSKMYG